jgi:nucleoside-diphosphate-sugar epimerase
MRVMAIGATGFIGRHVVAQLLEAGHEVAVLHRGNVPLSTSSGVAEILGDRSNLIELRNEFRKWAPDVVVDMILSSARQAHETLEAFHGIASRVVAISSGDAYRAMAVLHRLDNGPIQPIPITEDSALRTETKPYSAEALAGVRLVFPWINDEYDKVQVENAIASDPELPATIVRLPMVYGPGDLLHRLYSVVKRMLDGRPAIFEEQAFAPWVPCRGYVENVAHGIVLAATTESAAGRIFNIAEPERDTEAQWTSRIGEILGWRGRVVALPREAMPKHLLTPHNFEQHLFMDSSRIRAELGYKERVPVSEALRRTIEWEKANPPERVDPAQYDYQAEDEALSLLSTTRTAAP